jgi:hypothetical protein
VVLVQHHAVEVEELLVGVDLFVEILVQELRAVLGIEEAVRRAEEAS